jgi:hypothetical protein
MMVSDTNYDRFNHVTFLNNAAGDGSLNTAGDNITDRGIAPPGASRDANAHHLAGARIIRNS